MMTVMTMLCSHKFLAEGKEKQVVQNILSKTPENWPTQVCRT